MMSRGRTSASTRVALGSMTAATPPITAPAASSATSRESGEVKVSGSSDTARPAARSIVSEMVLGVNSKQLRARRRARLPHNPATLRPCSSDLLHNAGTLHPLRVAGRGDVV